MIPQGQGLKLLKRPSAFHEKGRHNLLLYLCLLAIALIFIVASPAQAEAGNFSAHPAQPGLSATGNDSIQECTSPAGLEDFPPVLPYDMPEASP